MNSRIKEFDQKIKSKWKNKFGNYYRMIDTNYIYHFQELNESGKYVTIHTFDESSIDFKNVKAFRRLHELLTDGSDRTLIQLYYYPNDSKPKNRVIAVKNEKYKVHQETGSDHLV